MALVRIHLKRLIQDSQDYGSDDEHMVSRVFFDLDIGGTKYEGLYADVKQVVGTSFESSPLEVSRPTGYTGLLNYEAYREVVEDYYRSLVGAQGSGIRFAGASSVRMRNSTFVREHLAEFEVEAPGGGWWAADLPRGR